MASRRDVLIAISAISSALPAAAAPVLSAKELQLTMTLTDLIIPRTATPGASDAKVHSLIEGLANADSAFARKWKAVLKAFGPADPAAAVEKGFRSQSAEFKILKDTTVDLYYSTREGLSTELGWNANTYVEEFRGCDE